MTGKELKQQQLIQLKEILITWFTQDELEDISFDLGIDYNALRGSTKESNIRNLLMMLSRRGRLDGLIENCDKRRPEIEWGIFTHLNVKDDEPSVTHAREAYQSDNAPFFQRYRFLLSLVGMLLIVIVVGASAAAFYLTRTSTPVSAEPGLVIQVPARETPAREPAVVVLSSPSPTPTNIVQTAIPSGNVDGRNENNDGEEQPIRDESVEPTATTDLAQEPSLEEPILAKVTDTYQDVPLKEANIRSGPGVEYPVLAQRSANASIEVWGYATNSYGTPWYKISLGEGFGWISSVLVELNQADIEQLPLDYSFEPLATPTPEFDGTPDPAAAN